MSILVPNIFEEGKGYDLFSKLLKERIVLLNDEVNPGTASIICAALHYLDKTPLEPGQDSTDIKLFINSPGGCVHSGLAIYDTMKLITCDVATVVAGMAASMGAFLLAGGTKGKRFALENAQIMIHQVSSGTRGHVRDQEISLRHTQNLNRQLFEIMAKNTNTEFQQIKRDADRDLWMSAEEAQLYGVVDHIGRPGTGTDIVE